jgi:hypothetical protein
LGIKPQDQRKKRSAWCRKRKLRPCF